MKIKSSTSVPIWRDKRIIPVLLQIAFAVIVISSFIYLFNNALKGLERIGISLGFGFLKSNASFAIGETIIPFSPSDSYYKAFLVGLLNTLKVAFVGIIVATILGTIIAISRLSNNWLARKVSGLYVEIFRNTPCLVQIFIWYFAVFLQLPRVQNSVKLPGSIYLSNKGFTIPWFTSTPSTFAWVLFFTIGVIGFFVTWKVKEKQQINTGKRKYPLYSATGMVLMFIIFAWIFTSHAPFNLTYPILDRMNYMGGHTVSPEFAAILFGLVFYHTAYIGEIVRGGILSVPRGDVEAAKALGLKGSTIMRMVILPQAFRVVIPPVTSHYINLIKNSSLAIAVGYPEIFSVGSTTLNQTGRAIEVITIMIAVYFTLNYITSTIMNIFNKRTQLVER